MQIALEGKGEGFRRLRERLFTLVEILTDRVADAANASESAADTAKETTHDAIELATDVLKRSIIDRPKLTNDNLAADIVVKFADAKLKDAQADAIVREQRRADQAHQMDMLERMLRVLPLAHGSQFRRIGNDGHLLLGVDPREIGEPLLDDPEPEGE
ncbi:MAG: hypothetical protein ACYTFA_18685 [Planctomycetota bacterium]